MQKTCQIKGCRNERERGQKFCPPHQIRELKRMQAENPRYFQPLHFRTMDGKVRLSRHRFLLLETAEQEMMQETESRLLPYCGDC